MPEGRHAATWSQRTVDQSSASHKSKGCQSTWFELSKFHAIACRRGDRISVLWPISDMPRTLEKFPLSGAKKDVYRPLLTESFYAPNSWATSLDLTAR